MMRAVLLLVLLWAGVAGAQQTTEVQATWTAPTTGTPVETYILQLSVDEGPFTTYATTDTTNATITVEALRTYVARVAGVDAQDRQGPWSETSDPYTFDPGPPGAPMTVEISVP
jgi:hypothetical protein